MTNFVQEKIAEFIKKDKFTDEIWESRGLNSSGPEMSNRLNNFFNHCAKNLLNSDESDFKNCLIKDLYSVDKMQYDTEEREFIADYFLELSRICSIEEFGKELDKWMYGERAGLIKPKESLGEIIPNTCTNCGGDLNTEIVARQEGIPDHAYIVVKCNTCLELNMLEFGPGIKQFSFGNYTMYAQLPKSEYSLEQAKTKLEELKAGC